MRTNSVARVAGRNAGNDGIHQVQVRSQVVGCVPLNAADIRSCGDRGSFGREMAVHVGVGGLFGCEKVCRAVGRVGWWEVLFGEGNDVEIVQKDPEDLLSYADGFLAPHSIGPFLVHVQDKGKRAAGFIGLRVAKVAENAFGSDDALSGRGGSNVREEDGGDNVSSRKFAWTFAFWIKNHVQEFREDISLDVVEVFHSQCRGGKCLETQ